MSDQLLQKKRELLKKKRELLDFQESLLAEKQTEPTKVGAVLSGLAQGATFGFADELASVASGVKGALTTPGDLSQRAEAFGLDYATSHADSELRRNELKEAFPKTSFGSELLGGAGSGGALFGALSKTALKSLPLIPRVAGVGAAEGAAFGAGASDPGERLGGAGFGAGVGFVGGPLAVGGISAGMSVLRPIAQRLGDALFGVPRDRAVKMVMQSLDAEDITADEAFTLLRSMGRNATLADLGDAPARLGRVVTAEAGAPASSAKRFLDFRQLESQQQLRQAARRATGASDFDAGVIQVINNAESAAAPLYRQAYEQVITVTHRMLDLLNRDAMKAARRKAAVILRNEGWSTDIVNDVTDVRYMDAVKRALDDQINAAYKAGRSNEARVLTGLKRQFVDEIDAQVPVYAQARQIFSGEAAMRDAAEVGRTMFKGQKMTVRDARSLIENMSESELQAARYGFLEWLSDDLLATAATRNTMANKFANVPKFREMARLLFPTQRHVDDFLRAASAQSRFGQTRNMVTGGSPTARIQTDRQAMSPGLLRVASDAAFSQLNGITSALRLLNANTAPSKEVLEEIGKILFNPRVIPDDLVLGPARFFDIPRTNPLTASGIGGGLVGSQQDDIASLLNADRAPPYNP